MKKKMIILVGIIAAIVVAVIAFFVVNGIVQEGKFNSEMEKINKLDITKDKIDMKIYTSGKYGVVEKTIKEYFEEYQKVLQDTTNAMQDEKIINMLSIDNYKKDGKEFKESLSYLSDYKKKLEEKFDNLISLSQEETIMKRIEDKNVGARYEKLYKDAMFAKDGQKQLEETNKELEDAKKTMINLLDVEKEVLEFLKSNKSHWELSNNQIVFDSTSLLVKYNSYLRKIK